MGGFVVCISLSAPIPFDREEQCLYELLMLSYVTHEREKVFAPCDFFIILFYFYQYKNSSMLIHLIRKYFTEKKNILSSIDLKHEDFFSAGCGPLRPYSKI